MQQYYELKNEKSGGVWEKGSGSEGREQRKRTGDKVNEEGRGEERKHVEIIVITKCLQKQWSTMKTVQILLYKNDLSNLVGICCGRC